MNFTITLNVNVMCYWRAAVIQWLHKLSLSHFAQCPNSTLRTTPTTFFLIFTVCLHLIM